MKKPTPRGEATAQTGVESHSTCISETKRETSKCRNWCEQVLSYQAPSTLQLPPLHGTQHKTWEKGRFANTPENLLLNNIPQQCSPMFLAPETDFVEDNFSMDWAGVAWDGDDSSASDLLCTLFLLLSAPPQIIRHWILRLGDPAPELLEGAWLC